MYKLLKDEKTGEIAGVLKDDVIGIPFAPDNTDYQEYLKWVAEGNEPLPAENE
jgi:hypothetical protein